jgi:hypothetical protein
VSGGDKVFSLEKFKATRDAKRKASTRKRRPRRPPIPTPFACFPYACSDKLRNSKAHWTAWALWFHLDQLIYGPSRKEPLTVSVEVCKSLHFTQRQANRALRQLECAGLIAVCRRDGRHNVVTPLWRQPVTP